MRGGLWLASGPYGLGVACRNWLFDRGWRTIERAGIPVVSIGNLTLGGTGKTPCVEYVARYFRDRECTVAILSRGYGSQGGQNDEALLLEQNLPDVPHLQGADRASLAKIAVEELESDLLVLDDGFQHRRLARDLDIVMVDATNPWGYGRLFPRGLLREPVRSLRRAGAIVLSRCDQVEPARLEQIRQTARQWAPGIPVAESVHQPTECINAEGATLPLKELSQKAVVAFCGLGNPESFRKTLASLGSTPCELRIFPDHHAYTRADVEELRGWAAKQAMDCLIVTTQKDLVKLCLTHIGGRPLWALRIGLRFLAGQDELDLTLEKVRSTCR